MDFWAPWIKRSVCLFLMIRGSESGCLGLDKRVLGIRDIAKNNFPEVGILMFRFHGPFLMILGDTGTRLMTLEASETGLILFFVHGYFEAPDLSGGHSKADPQA